MCLILVQWGCTFASAKRINPLNQTVMNTDNALAFLSSLASSDSSYRTLVDMINDMDLEIIATQQL